MNVQTKVADIDDLVDQAKKVLPGGSFGNMPAEVIIRDGKGGRVWDEAGKEYVDFLLGSGPMFIGHAHPAVTEAVQAQVPLGTTFFGNNRHGIALAEAVVEAVPCAEQVRFVCTGTEADLYAMRAVRAFRKKDKVLKFEGGYHGMSDYALMSTSPKKPGNFPRATPNSAGIPRSVADEMIISAFNDAEMTESLIREHKNELAGVIVEPFQRLLPPRPGFLQALRKMTQEHGIPLIFDEVVTGFRFAYGGRRNTTASRPISARSARSSAAALRWRRSPAAPTSCATSTSWTCPRRISCSRSARCRAIPSLPSPASRRSGVLRTPGAYEQVFATGRELMATLQELMNNAGIKAQVVGEPPLFDVYFTDQPIKDYRGTLKNDGKMSSRFNQLLRARGLMKGETKYYVSLAHTRADIDHTIAAWKDAIDELKIE